MGYPRAGFELMGEIKNLPTQMARYIQMDGVGAHS